MYCKGSVLANEFIRVRVQLFVRCVEPLPIFSLCNCQVVLIYFVAMKYALCKINS